MMLSAFKAFATPFTVGLFFVSTISGIALFQHVGESEFHEMHEWLSTALLIPAALHLWRNWVPLVAYLKCGRLLMPVGLCLVIALGFAGQGLLGGSGGGNPGFAAVNLLLQERLVAVAPIIHASAEDVAAKLRAKGYVIASMDATLGEIATASGREPPRMVADLAAMAPAVPGL